MVVWLCGCKAAGLLLAWGCWQLLAAGSCWVVGCWLLVGRTDGRVNLNLINLNSVRDSFVGEKIFKIIFKTRRA